MPSLTRREFIGTAGRGTASVALFGTILQACGVGEDDDGPQVLCREPTTREEETFVAIADTIVPGVATDPDGIPGAVEGCVLNLASDPTLPVASVVSFLVTFVDEQSDTSFGASFLELSLAQRTEILVAAEAAYPLLAFAFKFFRGAHYADLYNDVGPRSLGYPGGNLGYIDDPEFAFGEAVSAERTPDGNMP